MKSPQYWTQVLVLAFAGLAGQPACAEPAGLPIAGLQPDRRPAVARITADTPQDKRIALHGVSEPYPASLKFLDNQGGWFTPFTHPGMPAPYDLRGWHANPPSSRQKTQ
ncbi:MAG TPA: hypothetical protein PKC23_11780 [Candidatus Desulfobacillus sp.]|nr:hypothetical protein [Candidatus Desulfobacillus sp.]